MSDTTTVENVCVYVDEVGAQRNRRALAWVGQERGRFLTIHPSRSRGHFHVEFLNRRYIAERFYVGVAAPGFSLWRTPEPGEILASEERERDVLISVEGKDAVPAMYKIVVNPDCDPAILSIDRKKGP